MSSERYDEAVREQKKAERKKQVQKQVMILVIALVVIAVAAAAVFFTIKGKKSEPKDTTKASSSGLAGAISASYETFASEADPDASAEDVKKEAEDFAAWRGRAPACSGGRSRGRAPCWTYRRDAGGG